MPECVNVGVGGDILGVVVKCLTRAVIMEVDGERWKSFTERLTRLKEEYIIGFIRRHLGVSLMMEKETTKETNCSQQEVSQQDVRLSEESNGLAPTPA